MKESKTTTAASRLAGVVSRSYVSSGEGWDEEGPARESKELNDGGQYTDRRRYRDDLEFVANQHLAEEHRKWGEKDCGEHEAVPDKLQWHATRVEPAENVTDGAAENGWVLEETSQNEEEHVERDREPDQQGSRRMVKAQAEGACDSVLRNIHASRRPVTNA